MTEKTTFTKKDPHLQSEQIISSIRIQIIVLKSFVKIELNRLEKINLSINRLCSLIN